MDFNNIGKDEIVFMLLLLALLWQLIYYFFLLGRLAFKKIKKRGETELPPASVVICARNEDENLENNIPLIMEQNYPDFEVVVVNDCSWDNTEDVLSGLLKRYPNLRVIKVREDKTFTHGKKIAVMLGVKGAKNEYLLLTDADCAPVGKDWLKEMMSCYNNNTDIVLGYGAFEKKPGFLNKLIRYDAASIAVQYFSMALAGKAYMGVGRNLSYKKTLFFEHKGFASHMKVESGDDDLFVNEAASKKNVNVSITKESFTISTPKSSFKEWFYQKKRHLTTYPLYKMSTKMWLGAIMAGQYLFYALLFTSLALSVPPLWILYVYSFRLLMQLIIHKIAFDKLNEKDLFLFSPLLEIFLLLFYPSVFILNLISPKNKWKV